MSEDAPPPGTSGDRSKSGGVAVGLLLTPLLAMAGLSLMGEVAQPPEGLALPARALTLVPIAAAIPFLVGCGLLFAGRNRQFALGLLIGSAVVLIVAPATCFAFLYVAYGA